MSDTPMPEVPPPTTYPEHERMSLVADESQSIGEFLEWLEEQGITLCRDSGYQFMPYEPQPDSITVLLARYFSIDLNTIENEKRAMLTAIRESRRAA